MRALVAVVVLFCSVAMADDKKYDPPFDIHGSRSGGSSAQNPARTPDDAPTFHYYGYIYLSVINGDSSTQSRLEQAIAKGLRKMAQVKTSRESTNLYGNGNLKDLVREYGFDAVLIVDIGNMTDERRTAGTISQGSANLYGNSVYATGTTVAIQGHRRSMSATASLYDAKTGAARWSHDFQETTRGLHARSDSHVIGDISEDVVKGLRQTGLISR